MMTTHRSGRALGAIAAVTAMILASGPARSMVLIDVTQSGGGVDVTASGSLDITGATFDHEQAYTTGIIPGGANWYVALGTTPGMDWYQLTSVSLPYGTSGTYFSSGMTSGDAFSIWGNNGGAPLVGVSTGYTSGTAISASMSLAGQTIAGMTLIPGTYVFTVPNDTITLHIAAVPEPSTWALLALGLAGIGLARHRASRINRRAAA
ncbi:MAG TPA: PEP-CTERM sorting domain-containing protein [Burkholderiaceae bacterium]|nr:PEP-CTERM sorting domain-containing protein [Burkholderiaceae bacterium]